MWLITVSCGEAEEAPQKRSAAKKEALPGRKAEKRKACSEVSGALERPQQEKREAPPREAEEAQPSEALPKKRKRCQKHGQKRRRG